MAAFAAKVSPCVAGGGAFFAEGFFACPVAGFFCFGFFLTGERTGDSCEGLVTRRMPGGRVAAVEAETAAPSDDAALKVTLECDGEVTLRDGDEIESRFLPVRANSLSSVDCDDMMERGSWFRTVAMMGSVRRRFKSDEGDSGVGLRRKRRALIRRRGEAEQTWGDRRK